MPTPRYGPPAGVIDGKLYVASGCCVTQLSPFTRFTVLEVYDPATDTWTTKTDIPTGVYSPAVGVIGGKLYLAGGHEAPGNSAILQIYNPATDSWTTGTAVPERGGGAAAGVIGGKLYVAGGMNASNTDDVTTLRVYDPVTNLWALRAPMPTGRLHSGAVVISDILYVVGGVDGANGIYYPTVEAYDPATNTWTTKAPMPTPRFGLTVAELGGILYAVGGWTGGPLDIVETYDPATNTWTVGDPMPTARALPASGVVNGVMYVVGGAGISGPAGNALISANEAFAATTANLAPTANAGLDQTRHAGTTVSLDGSASFDDNTPTALLAYAWTLSSTPDGSAAVLNGANTATPNFLPDAVGTYVVQLVVTDQGGLASAPDVVVISSTNQTPSADAGADQLVMLSGVVSLSGSGFDPDGDSVGFTWTLPTRPVGSSAQLTGPNTSAPTFVPDLPGLYVAQLVVTDGFGNSAPDSVQVTAITAADYSQMQIQTAASALNNLPATSLTTSGNQQALMNHLSQAVQFIQSGDLANARLKLEMAITRTNGCAVRGAPDGNGPSRDWITTCAAQGQVYPSLIDALAALTP